MINPAERLQPTNTMSATQQPETLEFSYNWNGKLDAETFTSLRLSSRFEIGQKVEIKLKKEIKGPATVIDKLKLESIYKINNWISHLDTGYPPDECRKVIKAMYPRVEGWEKKPIYLYLFKYDESPLKGKKKELSALARKGIETGSMVEIGKIPPGTSFMLGEIAFTKAAETEDMATCYISGGGKKWIFPIFMMVEPIIKGGE